MTHSQPAAPSLGKEKDPEAQFIVRPRPALEILTFLAGAAPVVKWGLFLGCFTVYWFFFPFVVGAGYDAYRAASLLHIVLAGLMWGVRGGVPVVLVFMALSYALVILLGFPYLGGILAPIIGLSAVTLVGRLTDLSLELKDRLENLAQAEAKLREYGDHLENQVDSRTRDLTLANRRLAREMEHRRKAEEDKLEMERRMAHSQKLEALGTLTGGLSHNFNNILQGLMSGMDLVIDSAALDPANRQRMETMRVEVRRASDLIRQMLNFSRRSVSERLALDLNREVNLAVSVLRGGLPPGVEIVLDLEEDLPPLLGDPSQIEQAVMNLGKNAADAMPRGGRITINTRAMELFGILDEFIPPLAAGLYLELSVADEGQGMPPEVVRHMFEPFFTTKPPGKGTGLGLPSVYGTVEAHGGRIDFQTAEGRGTIFRMLLPAAPQAALASTPPRPETNALGLGGDEDILVVDDQPAVLSTVGDFLLLWGYKVRTAGGIGEAEEQIAAGTPDLVILDLGLPDGSGEEYLAQLRERYPDTRIIVTTGYQEEGLDRRLITKGADAFLSKPYRMLELVAAARRALDSSGGDGAALKQPA